MFYVKQISTNQMVTGSRSVPNPSQVFPNVPLSDIETGEISESDFIKHIESSKTYADKRKPLYGTWEEQLDMMYHGTWKDHIAKVKADIPKGNS